MALTLKKYLDKSNHKNICLSGGVVLNSVFVGRIKKMFPQIENIYVTATPHDGGLAIGAAQYVWYQTLGNPREFTGKNLSPYLGRKYTKQHHKNFKNCSHNLVISLIFNDTI